MYTNYSLLEELSLILLSFFLNNKISIRSNIIVYWMLCLATSIWLHDSLACCFPNPKFNRSLNCILRLIFIYTYEHLRIQQVGYVCCSVCCFCTCCKLCTYVLYLSFVNYFGTPTSFFLQHSCSSVPYYRRWEQACLIITYFAYGF